MIVFAWIMIIIYAIYTGIVWSEGGKNIVGSFFVTIPVIIFAIMVIVRG